MLRKTYTENRKNSLTYACDMKTTLELCPNEKLDGFGIGAAPPREWSRFDRLDTFKFVISHLRMLLLSGSTTRGAAVRAGVRTLLFHLPTYIPDMFGLLAD